MLGWTNTGFQYPRCQRREKIGLQSLKWCNRIIGFLFSHPSHQRKPRKELLTSGSTCWKTNVSVNWMQYYSWLWVLSWILMMNKFIMFGFQPAILELYLVHAQTEENRNHWDQEVLLCSFRITSLHIQWKLRLARSMPIHFLIWSPHAIKHLGSCQTFWLLIFTWYEFSSLNNEYQLKFTMSNISWWKWCREVKAEESSMLWIRSVARRYVGVAHLLPARFVQTSFQIAHYVEVY